MCEDTSRKCVRVFSVSFNQNIYTREESWLVNLLLLLSQALDFLIAPRARQRGLSSLNPSGFK